MRVLRVLKRRRSGRVLIALSAVILIYTFATSIMQYNLALFTDGLTVNYSLFGLAMGLPWFFSLLTDMPSGALADRFGRKRTIVLGLLGLGTSGVLLFFVSGLVHLFWVLVLFGVFEGFLTVAGMASVIAASPDGKENQFVGGYMSASAIGYTIGPLAGGATVAWLGGGMPFLVFAGICFFAALVAQILIVDTRVGRHETFFHALGHIIFRDRIWKAGISEFFSVGPAAILISCVMIFAGMWSEFIWAMEPLFVAGMRSSPLFGGLILASFTAPFALFDYPMGRYVDRTQRRFASLVFGLAGGGVSIILFSMVTDPFLLIALSFASSTSFALFFTAADGIFDTFSDHHRRGYMTGVFQSSEDIGYVVGPIFGGMVADAAGLGGAFVVFGGLSLVFALWVLKLKEHIKVYEKKAA